MTTIERLRALARDLAGEAWDYKRRHLAAQAHVRRKAAKTVMKQADAIQREDAIFEDPPMHLEHARAEEDEFRAQSWDETRRGPVEQ